MTKPVRDHVWRAAWKKDALTQQGGVCAYCRSRLTGATVTADHVEPRKAHGADCRENIKGACLACNKAKGHMGEQAFMKLVKAGGNTLESRMVWASRRINLATERSCKRLRKYAGLPA